MPFVRLDEKTYKEICKMAHDADRTIGGQVRYMTSMIEKLENIYAKSKAVPEPVASEQK